MIPGGSCSKGCLSGIFAMIGLVLAIAAGIVSLNTWRARSSALHAQGTVIRLDQQTDSDGGTQSTPVVSYQVNDRSYQIVGTVHSSPPAYQVGQRITVLYPPGKPAEGHIDSLLEQWFLPLILGVVALVFGLIGIGATFFGRRTR